MPVEGIRIFIVEIFLVPVDSFPFFNATDAHAVGDAGEEEAKG